MALLWERLRSSPRLKGAFLFLVVALIIVPGAIIPSPADSPIADAERVVFDWQMRALRRIHPRPVAGDIVLIGIDEETYAAYREPLALWHGHFAETLHALARANPRAVGVDVALPSRSYDFILPRSDFALMRALVDLKRSTVLVYVQTIADNRVDLVDIQPNFRNILTRENLGVDQQEFDPDLASRRFEENIRFKDGDELVPSLAGQILRRIGVAVDRGNIDYSLGAPLDYVPMHKVAQWDDASLRKAFEGRVVLVGSLIGGTDRWRLPVRLLANDPGRVAGGTAEGKILEQPGVLIHAQVLRSHLGSGLLHPLPTWLQWLAVALAALAVFVRASPGVVLAGVLLFPLVIAVLGLTAIVSAQTLVPVAAIIITFWTALIVRGVFDAIEAVVDRLRLRTSFAGQVSPAVMKEMLDGSLAPGVSGQLAEVCVLFSDVRDFTTLSENMPPVVVTTVLKRYFDRMVHAVHRYDGTVDKFIGDGMMVLFGAPRKSADPCGDAVQCALAMMKELDQLNTDFEREGLPVLTIGIGINYGTVTVGNIGSSERHNYSAIGDAVNVAARVEGLTKDLGRKIIITEAVVGRIGERFHFDPLGTHNVKGHSPVMVWGIRTARAAPVAAVEAEAVQ
jgi:class 3 adenylate cyclase/CHASE2 domain-containing sensor protein